jgi:protein-L-isoaspartate(D-aspartate) O-methyltransferase
VEQESRRQALVETLIDQGIRDERVLAAMGHVPREAFVDEGFAAEAYANQPLPISCGQTISQPYIVALMTEALQLAPEHRVLEIGTGSGYQAAVLSHLCREVHTIERHRELADQAGRCFARLKLSNIFQTVGDGTRGVPEAAPFDRIIVTAAADQVPEPLLDQLAPGGIMVVPVEERPGYQLLYRITRDAGGFSREKLITVRFVPLVGGGLPGQGGTT